MEEETAGANGRSEEVRDNLTRSTKKVKTGVDDGSAHEADTEGIEGQYSEDRRKTSYRDKALGDTFDTEMGDVSDVDLDSEVSDDDPVEGDD